MTQSIELRKLTSANFKDYEFLTSCESGGGCYCSFWHQKWNSLEEWERRKKEGPELNREIVQAKMNAGFHVGVLAYQGDKLIAWLSVGPIIEFYWTWRRVIQVGESAKSVAGITCFTVAKEARGQGLQSKILEALKAYGKTQGWSAIEGYPFDPSALAKHKEHVIWPGLTQGFAEAGFKRVGPHWLSNPDAERSIYRIELP